MAQDTDEKQDAQRSGLPPYKYTLKHRWAIKLNFLSGITLLPWLRLLWRHWRSIDWAVYPHRVLFLSVMAVVNSILSLLDTLLFSRSVSRQPLHPEPLFILGHPRTGTTHLHNLLSCDTRFAFANTFHAGFPSSFLSLSPLRWLLSGLLEATRPMDAMALHWDLPAEDEIAVNVLTGGDSPYLALVFPRLWRTRLRSYLTFEAAGALLEAEAEAEAGAEANTAEEKAEGRQKDGGGGGGTATGPAATNRRTGRAGGGGGATGAGGTRLGGVADGGDARGNERSRVGRVSSGVSASGSGDRGGCGGEDTCGGEGGGAMSKGGGGADLGTGRSDPRVVTAAFQRWLSAFMWFMKKVTYFHARQRSGRNGTGTGGAPGGGASAARSGGQPHPHCPPPLLIKSPVHTARLRLWLRLFPRARFVYVHRHPLEVFQSAAHMADTYYWYTYLQRPTDNDTNDYIMDQYELMYRSYMADRELVPAGRLAEVSFSELDADPVAVLERIYNTFGWGEHFQAALPKFSRYVASLADFKKNHFNSLSPEVEAVVRRRWAPSFRAFGYT